MKVSKRQLRQIIKEEKTKLLNEMNPMANAERSQSMYASTSMMADINTLIGQLMDSINVEALEDTEDDEIASEAAIDAVLLTISDAIGDAGYPREAAMVKDIIGGR